jgi:hypothetical protein
VTCRVNFSDMFDTQVVGDGKEYVHTVSQMTLRNTQNSFRYNLDFVDIKRWAEDKGIDTTGYKLIGGTVEEIQAEIDERNNVTFKGEDLEHIKPLTPNKEYDFYRLIDASNEDGEWEEADKGTRIKSSVSVTLI